MQITLGLSCPNLGDLLVISAPRHLVSFARPSSSASFPLLPPPASVRRRIRHATQHRSVLAESPYSEPLAPSPVPDFAGSTLAKRSHHVKQADARDLRLRTCCQKHYYVVLQAPMLAMVVTV